MKQRLDQQRNLLKATFSIQKAGTYKDQVECTFYGVGFSRN